VIVIFKPFSNTCNLPLRFILFNNEDKGYVNKDMFIAQLKVKHALAYPFPRQLTSRHWF